jgi:hypothetical protein
VKKLVLLLTALATGCVMTPAPAQHHHPKPGGGTCAFGDYACLHDRFHDWYNTAENGKPIMRPHMPSVKCCEDDCRPTKAELIDGKWYVLIDGGLAYVHPSRIKSRETLTQQDDGGGGTAHVCAARRTPHGEPEIYCFIPPELQT